MKILFSAQNLFDDAGGAEKCAQTLLKRLAKTHVVHALCRGKRGDYVWEGVNVHEVSCPNSIPYIHLRWKKHLDCLKIAPELVITQLNAAAPTIHWAKKHKAKTIFYIHSFEHFCPEGFEGKGVFKCGRRCLSCGGLKRRLRSPAYRLLRRSNRKAILEADVVISPSEYMKDVVAHYTGRGCDVIPNPLDLSLTKTDKRGEAILFVNPKKHKGVDLVGKLVRLMPGRNFVLAGEIDEEYDWLKGEKNVKSLGRVADMRIAYGMGKVLLAPSSEADNFPSVVLEAMANGIPCITSDARGVLEAAGAAGVKVAVDDVDGWVSEIERMYNDPKYYGKMRLLCLGRAEEFDLDKSFDKLGKLVKLRLGMSLFKPLSPKRNP